MKIAICDDDVKDLHKIETLLLKYKTLYPNRNFMLEKFTDSAKLCHEIADGRLADIYILDMLMPGKTGIDVGRQIREFGSDNAIIYITSSDDYALDAYGVHAVRYLSKPIHEEKLFEALDYCLSYTETSKEPVYPIKTKDGLMPAPYSKIEYIESAGRKLEVHMTNGEIIKSIFIRKSFEESVHDIAEKRNFQQVHKSFLVNLDYVKRLTMESITMESGKQIPVSKTKAAAVKREYLLFISGKYK